MGYRDYTDDDLKEVVELMDDYQIPETGIDEHRCQFYLSLKDRVLIAIDNVRRGVY